jgi:hypothetical protein
MVKRMTKDILYCGHGTARLGTLLAKAFASNGTGHRSDCAVHNMPAEPNGPCDCGFIGAISGETPSDRILNDKDFSDKRFSVELPGVDYLFDADPDCKHSIISAPGGGVKCTKCKGWFCY